ncbi:c-type cytochrome [Caenimonas aquaedulcis]|uniref:C-type cytochrome n=1 Tax=Caenimonas aquaedulcis TaxID=2793270 RepID=A0A931H2K3_9BURK|nr:c-type cytochrome [Caenimonas aquaedulcis]MBG9387412.1 c-type cytochrome [Caenimonas aquaedulcis]
MSRWVDTVALALCALTAATVNAAGFPGIGRDATPREVAAWDIDVRADFKGLPPGSGSVAKGQEVWEAKCASCHGVFGESNQVFNPLVGGTSADDVKTGRVASLARRDYPGRTTMMKVSQVSTLWDYINRAMPWTQPKSLTVEEVYATTAYLLNLADVVPSDFTLSDKNIGEVQQRLPNRNGMTRDHAMWPGSRTPVDVKATACMKNCAAEAVVTSALPDFARNAHGNLALQNRTVGAQRGIDTARGAAAAASAPAPAPALNDGRAVQALLQANSCTACHAASSRVVGPSWAEVAGKHAGKADYLAAKIRSGGSGAWGAIPMPPQTLSEADARRIAGWLAAGAAP